MTSPLSTRSAPPIPASADLFEPLVKAILRHRVAYNIMILTYSLVFSWIQNTWLVGSSPRRAITGYLITLIWPTTLLWSILRWATVPSCHRLAKTISRGRDRDIIFKAD